MAWAIASKLLPEPEAITPSFNGVAVGGVDAEGMRIGETRLGVFRLEAGTAESEVMKSGERSKIALA